MQKGIKIVRDLPAHLRLQAVEILYEAFEKKINNLELMPNSKEQAIRIMGKSVNFESGFYALCEGGVVGVTGLHYGNSRFSSVKWSTLFKEFGLFGALYRMIIPYFERLTEILKRGELRIDTIAVDKSMRGEGVGTLMLNEVFEFAKTNGFESIRLEVVDTNQGARKLYERMGFVATRTIKTGFLTRRAGFSAAINMSKQII